MSEAVSDDEPETLMVCPSATGKTDAMGSMVGATFCTLTQRSSMPLDAPSESVTSRRIL